MPFLITNPSPGVEKYEVDIDGTVVVPEMPAQADGSLKLDLNPFTLPDGAHRIQVRAGNVWGWSNPVMLSFDKAAPADPTGLRLSL